jgi:hypothetical protein
VRRWTKLKQIPRLIAVGWRSKKQESQKKLLHQVLLKNLLQIPKRKEHAKLLKAGHLPKK